MCVPRWRWQSNFKREATKRPALARSHSERVHDEEEDIESNKIITRVQDKLWHISITCSAATTTSTGHTFKCALFHLEMEARFCSCHANLHHLKNAPKLTPLHSDDPHPRCRGERYSPCLSAPLVFDVVCSGLAVPLGSSFFSPLTLIWCHSLARARTHTFCAYP